MSGKGSDFVGLEPGDLSVPCDPSGQRKGGSRSDKGGINMF